MGEVNSMSRVAVFKADFGTQPRSPKETCLGLQSTTCFLWAEDLVALMGTLLGVWGEVCKDK